MRYVTNVIIIKDVKLIEPYLSCEKCDENIEMFGKKDISLVCLVGPRVEVRVRIGS